MATQHVTLDVADTLYERLRRRAEEARRSVEDELLIRVAGFPEIGGLRPAAKKGCAKVGTPLSELGVFSEASLRYSPGDSARLQVVVFRRTGADAELLRLAAGEPDDEVDAEGEVFNLRWDAARGWQVGDCHALVRYWPGRP